MYEPFIIIIYHLQNHKSIDSSTNGNEIDEKNKGKREREKINEILDYTVKRGCGVQFRDNLSGTQRDRQGQ